jgi:hypothetical protein
MKNPFKKEDHTGLWIAAAVTGALASGFVIWFYLRKHRVAEQEACGPEYTQDYLRDQQSKKQQHKSDIAEPTDIAQHGHA